MKILIISKVSVLITSSHFIDIHLDSQLDIDSDLDDDFCVCHSLGQRPLMRYIAFGLGSKFLQR